MREVPPCPQSLNLFSLYHEPQQDDAADDDAEDGNYRQFLETRTALEKRYHALLVVADSLRAIAAERKWWELKWRPEERRHSTSFTKKDAIQ